MPKNWIGEAKDRVRALGSDSPGSFRMLSLRAWSHHAWQSWWSCRWYMRIRRFQDTFFRSAISNSDWDYAAQNLKNKAIQMLFVRQTASNLILEIHMLGLWKERKDLAANWCLRDISPTEHVKTSSCTSRFLYKLITKFEHVWTFLISFIFFHIFFTVAPRVFTFATCCSLSPLRESLRGQATASASAQQLSKAPLGDGFR